MMATTSFKMNSGSTRTKEELLDDVSCNGLWEYLEWAVEDAGSLDAERRSEWHMERIRAYNGSE